MPSREYKAETPMTKLIQRHVPLNVEAFGRLLSRHVNTNAATKVQRIYEGFGGLGNQTKWLRENLKCRWHHVWDTDPECCKVLEEIQGVKVHQGDFFEEQKNINPPQNSLVCVDYNNFTMNPTNMKRLACIFENGYRWIIGPDLARGKLHLNWERTYHIEKCDYDCYIEEFNRRTTASFGMRILGYEKAPRSITYVLWERS